MSKKPSAPATPTIGPWTWVGIIGSGLWLLINLVTSGISGVLIGAGVIALFTAIFSLAAGRLSWLNIPSRKAGALVLAGSLVVLFTGASLAPRPTSSDVVALVGSSTDEPSPTPTRTAEVKKPKVTTANVNDVQVVPFTESTVDDPNLAAGTTAVTTTGVNGQRTIVYKVTYTDGVETGRVVVSDTVTLAPVNQVVSNGTYVAPPPPAAFVDTSGGCDPNYSGACVPIDSDVDCAGGSGNGPSYVSGPVTVVGSDIYDLDRDGDGIGCD